MRSLGQKLTWNLEGPRLLCFLEQPLGLGIVENKGSKPEPVRTSIWPLTSI